MTDAELALRNLVAVLDGDGGQKQAGESPKESGERAEGVVVALEAEAARLREQIGVCDKCGRLMTVVDQTCQPCFDLWQASYGDKKYHESPPAPLVADAPSAPVSGLRSPQSSEAEAARMREVILVVRAERAARARFMAAALGGGPEVFTSETRQQAVDAYDAACLATERALDALAATPSAPVSGLRDPGSGPEA